MSIHNPSEINRRLAEEVMGWEVLAPKYARTARADIINKYEGKLCYANNVRVQFLVNDWNPYELITHAFMVVEKMWEKGWRYVVHDARIGSWTDTFSGEGNHVAGFYKHEKALGYYIKADTPSAAISLVALKAKGEKT